MTEPQQQQQHHQQQSAAYNLPEFQINFNIQTDNADAAATDKDIIELPLYSNSSREHLICTLKLYTAAGKETIILSGVALIVPDVISETNNK